MPELPGFYFDPEKNRYFRLLPGHNNCNPLTREKLQEKEREKQRSKMLVEDEKLRKVSFEVIAVEEIILELLNCTINILYYVAGKYP